MRKKLAAVTPILLLMRASGASAAEAAAPPVWRIDQARAEYTIKVHGFYAVTDLAQDQAGTSRARAWQYSRQLDVQVDQNSNFDVIAHLPGDEQNKIPSP